MVPAAELVARLAQRAYLGHGKREQGHGREQEATEDLNPRSARQRGQGRHGDLAYWYRRERAHVVNRRYPREQFRGNVCLQRRRPGDVERIDA